MNKRRLLVSTLVLLLFTGFVWPFFGACQTSTSVDLVKEKVKSSGLLNKSLAALKSILTKAFLGLVDLGKKALFWLGEQVNHLWQWLRSRWAALEQGIGEEKKELQEDLKNLRQRIPFLKQ